MTLSEAKQTIFDFVQSFFEEGTVAFEDQKMVRLPVPYITLKFLNINKQRFANKYDDKIYWEIKSTVSMNIYTQGKEVSVNDSLHYYENSAQDDLMDFIKYMESDGSTDWLSNKNVSLMLKDDSIKDLSMLLNDTTYRYRAYAEFDFTFTDEQAGYKGQQLAKNVPNSSGGGKSEYVVGDYYIEEVETKEEFK